MLSTECRIAAFVAGACMNFVWYGMVCRAAVDVDSEKNIIVFIKFNMASKLATATSATCMGARSSKQQESQTATWACKPW